MEKLGNVRTMAWGSVLCMTFVVSLIIPAIKSEDLANENFFLSKAFVYPLMLIASIATGVGEGIAHPAASKYITDCTTEDTKGFYFAFFWSFYMGSQVFGNLLAAYVLGYFDQRIYVIIISVVGTLATSLLFFMKSPLVKTSLFNLASRLSLAQVTEQQQQP
jgi:MFS family permease